MVDNLLHCVRYTVSKGGKVTTVHRDKTHLTFFVTDRSGTNRKTHRAYSDIISIPIRVYKRFNKTTHNVTGHNNNNKFKLLYYKEKGKP